jgi:hypothetical protein
LEAYFIDNQLTDGGKIVSPMHWLHPTPQKHYLSVSGTHFCYTLSKPQVLEQLEGLGKLKKIILPHRISNPQPSSL